MATLPLPLPEPPITTNLNNETLTQAGKDKESKDKEGIGSKVSSDGLSMPLMSDKKNSTKHLSRSLSYEKFLSENNERVILNVGGKRFETYPIRLIFY